MSDLYPLRLLPEFSPRPWGTRDLSPLYRDVPGAELIGEAWLTGDNCKVANGPLAGRTLGDLAKEYGRELVGETAPEPDRFPLLTKFIFPHDKLSVQVHPDDELARALGLPCGKTECWYVLQAEPGAQVALGLKPGTSKADLGRAIRETRAEGLLNWIDIHAGETIYVEAGTVHAIGPGSILVETQQNSDTTFRLYDYGRPRELHIEKGLKAVKEQTRSGKVKRAASDDGLLVQAQYFRVRKQQGAFQGGESESSASCLVALGGGAVVEAAGCEPVTFSRGEAVVVPARVGAFQVRGQWEMEVLWAAVPSGVVAVPETEAFATSTR
jgi:mannose-6-phosphate isomerase